MKAILSALVAFLFSFSSELSAHDSCADCVSVRGQIWEDITGQAGDFDLSCEFRITLDSFLQQGAVVFYPSYIGVKFLSVDYSKGNHLVVYSDNKAQTVGDHGTHNARTFQSCPYPIPNH